MFGLHYSTTKKEYIGCDGSPNCSVVLRTTCLWPLHLGEVTFLCVSHGFIGLTWQYGMLFWKYVSSSSLFFLLYSPSSE